MIRFGQKMVIDDKYLIRKVKAGDKTAFKILYKKYYAGLLIYSRKITRNEKISEELTDDLFMNIWINREKIEIKSSLRSYLFRSVRNNCLTYLKQNSLTNSKKEDYQERIERALDYLAISQENGLSVLLAKEINEDIHNAIEKLPEQCRIIFKMSRFDGLKQREIAERLGVSVNTVETQISRALTKLREGLKQYLSVLLIFFHLSL